MDSSDLLRRHHQYSQQQQQQQQQTMSSGLMRYRSAPSSYFASLLNSGADGGGNCDEFLNHRPTSPETERILARLISADAAQDSLPHNLEQNPSQFMSSMKQETDNFHHQESSGYSSGSQMVYQNQPRPSLPNQNSAASNSITVDQMTQMKMGGGAGNSNLIRQSSSPAGLFSHINIENGYGVIGRNMGNFGGGNGTNTEASFPSTNRLKGQMDFSSGTPSSSGQMTPISENVNKRMEMSGPSDRIFGQGHRNDRDYNTGFPIGSWDDSAILSDNFLQRVEDDDKRAFSGMNASENQNADIGNFPSPTVLSHHLSLPTSSAELSAMEKLLQFQDSVPCKIRAKRGCATHPRSIAERVRRTRISERMRKLQELVPNMDKQTNTADMLDLAVDYIKDLQGQVKTLSDNRAKCTCSNQQKLAQKA